MGYDVVKGLLERCWVSAALFLGLSWSSYWPYVNVLNYFLTSMVVLSFQWFAPSKLVVTFEREGPGAFTDDEVEGLVVKNTKGRVVKLNLPHKSVLIANHQVRYAQQSDRYVGS